MPLDESLIGRTYPPSEPYEVCREKIREFAAAIGDDNPAYRDAAAARALGHPDVVAPPTFPIVFTFPATRPAVFDPDIGIDYSMVVHGEQRFVYARPVHPGDQLSSTVTIEGARSAAGNDILSLRVDTTDSHGDHVVTAHMTIFARAKRPSPEEPAVKTQP
jgi:acyl dehydratase